MRAYPTRKIEGPRYLLICIDVGLQFLPEILENPIANQRGDNGNYEIGFCKNIPHCE